MQLGSHGLDILFQFGSHGLDILLQLGSHGLDIFLHPVNPCVQAGFGGLDILFQLGFHGLHIASQNHDSVVQGTEHFSEPGLKHHDHGQYSREDAEDERQPLLGVHAAIIRPVVSRCQCMPTGRFDMVGLMQVYPSARFCACVYVWRYIFL